MTTDEVYAELERRSLPLIEAYAEDLTKHDKAMLLESPGVPFLHWTKGNGCGTTMAMLLPTRLLPKNGERVPYLFGTADRDHIAKGPMKLAECYVRPFEQECKLVLYWDLFKFRVIDAKRAVEIARRYLYDLRDEWDREHRARSA